MGPGGPRKPSGPPTALAWHRGRAGRTGQPHTGRRLFTLQTETLGGLHCGFSGREVQMPRCLVACLSGSQGVLLPPGPQSLISSICWPGVRRVPWRGGGLRLTPAWSGQRPACTEPQGAGSPPAEQPGPGEQGSSNAGRAGQPPVPHPAWPRQPQLPVSRATHPSPPLPTVNTVPQ